MTILEKFLRYVKINTQSKEGIPHNPSTKEQFDLANLLVKELQEMGIKNAYVDEFCYVYAFIPTNSKSNETVGLIAHLDTATELTGKGVNPKVIENYDGSDIVLNENLNVILSKDDFASLKELKGHTLVTTDGTTLLGADDKAGIAIIMQTVQETLEKKLPHPNIIITFTPDEEVGMGTHSFNFDFYKKHNCTYAYTLDGGDPNEINYENFNAASATIEFLGKAIHPGSAKGKMINSLDLAMEFHKNLPSDMTPSKTEGYEGFNHLCSLEGGVENSVSHYIIRNHDLEKFETQKALFKQIVEKMNQKYGYKAVNAKITDSYFNMKEMVEKFPSVLEFATEAIKKENLTPTFVPIRGGTDGARLSFSGIITPNIGTGGGNYHGKYEYVSVDNMQTMVKIVLNIFENIIEK